MNAPSIDIELSGGYYLNSINRLISDLAPLLDLGRGITASLGDNPAYSGRTPDDAEAISFALEPTVTATPERNSGYGLAFTERLLRLNGGWMLVRSGQGHVQRGSKPGTRLVDTRLPGTLVSLRFVMGKPFDYVGAWDLLTADVEKILR